MSRKFEPGDLVRIICENQDAHLPEGSDAAKLSNHGLAIGGEYTLSDIEDDYDDYDNSWLLRGSGASGARPGGYDWQARAWVHEGALDYAIQPVTQAEEDEALESIRKALDG